MKIINKIFPLIIIAFILFACKNSNKTNERNNFDALDWLIGNWERTNDNPGRKTFENWSKVSEFEYIGEGFTLAENDTVFKEKLKIIFVGDQWLYEVRGVNENPTIFKFIEQSENSFISENKINEFPKIIEYSYSDNILKAKISNETNEIVFLFNKI